MNRLFDIEGIGWSPRSRPTSAQRRVGKQAIEAIRAEITNNKEHEMSTQTQHDSGLASPEATIAEQIEAAGGIEILAANMTARKNVAFDPWEGFEPVEPYAKRVASLTHRSERAVLRSLREQSEPTRDNQHIMTNGRGSQITRALNDNGAHYDFVQNGRRSTGNAATEKLVLTITSESVDDEEITLYTAWRVFDTSGRTTVQERANWVPFAFRTFNDEDDILDWLEEFDEFRRPQPDATVPDVDAAPDDFVDDGSMTTTKPQA